MIRRKKGI